MILRGIVRAVRLPFDLLFLIWDLMRLTVWGLVCTFLGCLGVEAPARAPCQDSGAGIAVSHSPCRAARKYGNPFLLRLLCPHCHREKTAAGWQPAVCGNEEHFRPSLLRCFAVALLLTVLFGGVAALTLSGLDRAGYNVPSVQEVVQKASGLLPLERESARPREKKDVAADAVASPLNRAQTSYAEGRYAEARNYFREAADASPSNPDAWIGLGDCARKLNMPVAAQEAYRTALQLDPERHDTRRSLRDSLLKHGDTEAALRHADKLCETQPQDAEARMVLSRCYAATDNLKQAVDTAYRAAELSPHDPEPLMYAAHLELRRERFEAAAEAYRRILAFDDRHVKARVGLGGVLARAGRNDEARTALDRALEDHPENVLALSQRAELYVAGGEFAKAIKLYRQTAGLHPEEHTARARLAELLLLTGKGSEAYKVAKAILVDHPTFARPHVILAKLFLDKELPSLAVDHAKKAVALQANPARRALLAQALLTDGKPARAANQLANLVTNRKTDLSTKLKVADLLAEVGKRDAAGRLLKQACRAHPESPQPWFEMAQLQLARKNTQAAVAAYEETLKRDPDHFWALNNLAFLLCEKNGSLDRAEKLVRKAHEQDPDNPKVMNTLGWILRQQGRPEEAIPLLRTAVTRMPENADAHLHLGTALADTGSAKEAMDVLSRAKELNPEAQTASKIGEYLDEGQLPASAPADE